MLAKFLKDLFAAMYLDEPPVRALEDFRSPQNRCTRLLYFVKHASRTQENVSTKPCGSKPLLPEQAIFLDEGASVEIKMKLLNGLALLLGLSLPHIFYRCKPFMGICDAI